MVNWASRIQLNQRWISSTTWDCSSPRDFRSPGQKPWFWHQNCRLQMDTHGSSSVNDLEKRSPDQILTYGCCFPSLTYRPIDSHRPGTLSQHPAACNRPSWKSVAHSSSKWKSQMRKRSLHQKRVEMWGRHLGVIQILATRMQQMDLCHENTGIEWF